MRRLVLWSIILLLSAGDAPGADSCGLPACRDQKQECCSCCGAKKVCKVVCETKEVKKTCWVVQCEEFCVPMPSLCRDFRCFGEACCGECGECCEGGVCRSLQDRPTVPPKCGKVRCRKKLVQKEITSKVPVYKCVLVPTCHCAD